jgi:hypothetical protein
MDEKEANIVCSWIERRQHHISDTRVTKQNWSIGGLNAGPIACKAIALPLS